MLSLENVFHYYGKYLALDDVSLSAKPGEFLTILGESGSGKTTLLRVISGLEKPSSVKRLTIAGENVLNLPPARRNCTTVFQNYALFPHMSVAENVAYGLSVRGIGSKEARRQAEEALETVRLTGMADRRISQLSGGQKQRVAIARCIVTRPAVMLLDEPLGALDERLRLDMQNELVDIQRQLGVTFIYITHSQEEALAMSDRIVLMRKGRIEQLGVPSDLFDRPVSEFAARFMGFENILSGIVRSQENGCALIELKGGSMVRAALEGARTSIQAGAPVQLALRAERAVPAMRDTEGFADRNLVNARPIDQRYRGKYSDISVETEAGVMKLRSWNQEDLNPQFNAVTWRPQDCVLLEASV